MAKAGPEIEQYASAEMAGLTASMDALKKKLADGDYAGVLTDATSLTSQIASAGQAAATKKAALAAEWTSMSTMPAMVAQVQAKIDELSKARRLPRGMNKATLDGAKTSLESVNQMWAEATAAQQKGDLAAAVAKAKEVKPMVDNLMGTLGIAMPAM